MPGPIHFFSGGPTTADAFAFPLALVPTFVVPILILTHLASLWKLWTTGLSPIAVRNLLGTNGPSRESHRRSHMQNDKVVLVTGVSSGIGRAIARALVGHGFTVYGTSRTPVATKPIAGVTLLPLDVRSEDSAQNVVATVLEDAGRLDVLINNAGFMLEGAVEETTDEDAKAQFETNFFGVLRMVRAVLPAMRTRRSGKIIHISSALGFAALPFAAVYSASKFALEGYTEALRHELKPFLINVSLIEPGFVRTALGSHGRHSTSRIPDYDRWRERAAHAIRAYLENASPPRRVAETVLQVIHANHPKLRYPVGGDGHLLAWLRRLAPQRVFEIAIRAHFRLDTASSSRPRAAASQRAY
jgi:NAD(P)-dependent dehydrogenase (short-subunit alcohol dehydrogenase family)